MSLTAMGWIIIIKYDSLRIVKGSLAKKFDIDL